MQKNLNFGWMEQVKRLKEDAEFTGDFIKFILTDMLHEKVEVETASVLEDIQKSERGKTDRIDIAATIVHSGYRRNMEISLYKNGCIEHDRSFKCYYYCIEAPSILLDSKRTSMNLEVKEDLLERWNNYIALKKLM